MHYRATHEKHLAKQKILHEKKRIFLYSQFMNLRRIQSSSISKFYLDSIIIILAFTGQTNHVNIGLINKGWLTERTKI